MGALAPPPQGEGGIAVRAAPQWGNGLVYPHPSPAAGFALRGRERFGGGITLICRL